MMNEKIFRWMEIGKKLASLDWCQTCPISSKIFLNEKINRRFGLDPLSFLISVFLRALQTSQPIEPNLSNLICQTWQVKGSSG
jgi:hypothetical protein